MTSDVVTLGKFEDGTPINSKQIQSFWCKKMVKNSKKVLHATIARNTYLKLALIGICNPVGY